MICKDCGKQIPDGALFCKYCGAHVQASDSEQTDAPQEKELNFEKAQKGVRRPAKKKKHPLTVVLTVVLIAALGVLAGVLIWRSGAKADGADPGSTAGDAAQDDAVTSAENLTASITPAGGEVEVGKNLMLSANIDQDLGNVSVKNTVWESSDVTVATVTDGIVYGVSVGQTEITATYSLSDNTSVMAKTTVQVKQASVVYTVTIDPSVASLKMGGTTTLVAKLDQSLENGVSIQSTVWSTNSDGVAVVSNGKVTAVGAGTAVISVTMNLSNGQATSATAQVTVEKPAPAQQPQTTETTENKPTTNTNTNANTNTQPKPSDTTTTPTGEYILPNSNSALVSYDALKALSDYQLRLARNEIYARHGRRFDDAQLQAYFDGKSWYNGTVAPSSFDAGVLNNTELENIKRIQEVEASR